VLFGSAALWLGLASGQASAIYLAVAVWGVSFGGAPSLFQTALAKTAGAAADVAQSMLVTTWNLAIAGGGIMGGVLIERGGVEAFIPVMLGLLAVTLAILMCARRHGFPPSV